MAMRKSRLSREKQLRLIEHFVAGTTARCAANLVGVNPKTAAFYFHRLREIIADEEANEGAQFGEFEVDESYFGGRRKGKRGRGAVGKVPVFGILKRGGRVYTQLIPNAKSKTLLPIIREKIQPDSIVYSDCWYGYNALDVSEFKHFRINHSKLFADSQNHINGIENFWNQAKRHLRKFNGIPTKHFHLFLKECEWRFNNPNPQSQFKQLKQWVKKQMGQLSGTAPKKKWGGHDYRQHCGMCHLTGCNPWEKRFTEPGVGCEACHGPGKNHAETERLESISTPGKDGHEVVATCRRCHNNRNNHAKAIKGFSGGYHTR